MPVYTVRLDGKKIKVRGDRPPTEQEVRGMMGESTPESKPPLPQRLQQAKQRVVSKNPLQRALDVLVKSAVDTVREGPTSFNVLTGGPATAFGSNLKRNALTDIGVSENLASAIAMGTDPQNVLIPSVMGRKAIADVRSPGSLQRLEAQKVLRKGTEKTARLLPSIDRSKAFARKQTPQADVEALRTIKATSDPRRIVSQLDDELTKQLDSLDQLIASKNVPIDVRKVTSRVVELLKKQFKNSNDADRKKIQNAIREELKFISEQGRFDAVKANARKRFLYEETQGLQAKQFGGRTIVRSPSKQIVKDKFAQAYKEAIEEVVPDAKEINKRAGGLIEAKKAAAKTAERSIEDFPLLEKVLSFVVGRPSIASGLAAAIRVLPISGRNIKSLTSVIEKLGLKLENLLAESRRKQLPRLIRPRGQRVEALPPGETPKGIAGPPARPSITGPLPQKQLPAGQGFELLTPEESSRILQGLSQKQTNEVVESLKKLGIELPEFIGTTRGRVPPRPEFMKEFMKPVSKKLRNFIKRSKTK